MTLSKAEWRAVRPAKLQNLDAAKLMEVLRRKPGSTIRDWQDMLDNCDELQRVLNRTPRMLGKAMPQAFRAALAVWLDDIDDLRKTGARALEDLGRAHVDDVCSAIAQPVIETAQGLIETLRAQIKADKKRAPAARDRRVYDRLTADLRASHDTMRLLRRQKMKTQLKDDRMAQAMIRGKHVRMGRFRMTCDPVMKGLQRAMADGQKQYDRLMNEASP